MGSSFVGRDGDLLKLERLLREKQGVVLSGGPGTGKSRLVAEFTHVRGGRGFWANGGATVERTLGGLAETLGIDVEGKDDAGVAAEVRRSLAGEPPDTLVVFDNVPDLVQTNALLGAAGQVRVIITTRDVRASAVPGHVGRQLVEVLDPQGAIALLEAQAPASAGDRSLPEIAEAVGHLPLALMALGTTLREGLRSPATLYDALQAAPSAAQFDAFTQALEGADLPHPAGVFAAFTEGFERLSDDARAAFSRLCYLADLPVPDGLARALTGIGDDTDAYGRWLDECQRHAVLVHEPGQVRIHALTAAAVRATNSDAALETALTSATARLNAISLPDPASTRNEIAHHEALEVHAEQHVDPMHPARLGFELELGRAFHFLGRAAESIAVFEAHTTRFQEALGAEHPDTLASRNNLANAYQDTGRNEEAIALHEENLQVRVRVLGAEHPETLAGENNLASAYRGAGRIAEAITMHEETLPVLVRVLGPEHPDTLASRNNLANAYQTTGRTEEALALHEENLRVRVRVLGAEHPETLASGNNLAAVYRAAGRNEEAVALHEENLQVRMRVLGSEHPDTLASQNNLAIAYHATGRNEEAIALHEENLQVRTRVLGTEHPDTLGSRNNLAATYGDVGRVEEAITMHEENLPVRVRVLGAEHPDTLASRNNLAAAYRAVGRQADADQLMAGRDEDGRLS